MAIAVSGKVAIAKEGTPDEKDIWIAAPQTADGGSP
jgi:hypothetical protein